ncbi:MAG: VOC family protein [Nitrospira sp.]|nr:VOC family protein [Nitrospira sp.]
MSPSYKEQHECKRSPPCLWFDDNADEAAKFYGSIFKNSKVTSITYYGEAGARASGRPKGSVMTVTFEIKGQEAPRTNGSRVIL